MSKTEKQTQGRRGFIAAVGAAAAATAIPSSMAHGTEPRGWTGAAQHHSTTIRAAYVAEVARLAMSLRARFASGELRAYQDGDDEGVFQGTGEADSPHWEVERICAEHFGLVVKVSETAAGARAYDGDSEAAFLVLSCSPHAACTEDDGYNHPCYHAQTAAAWDLICHARTVGWYTPGPDETEDPALGDCPHCDHPLWTHEDGTHGKAGCGVSDCDCKLRHTRHVPGVLS